MLASPAIVVPFRTSSEISSRVSPLCEGEGEGDKVGVGVAEGLVEEEGVELFRKGRLPELYRR